MHGGVARHERVSVRQRRLAPSIGVQRDLPCTPHCLTSRHRELERQGEHAMHFPATRRGDAVAHHVGDDRVGTTVDTESSTTNRRSTSESAIAAARSREIPCTCERRRGEYPSRRPRW